MTTIVLVDDHQIVRQGLRALLTAEEGFEILGEAADGLEALDIIRDLRPDIVIVDLNLPGLNGIDVVKHVTAECPATKVIALSMHSSEDYVLPVFASGAAGYVLKDACVDDLVQAIRQALKGSRYLSPQLAERAIDSYLHLGRSATVDSYDSLTQREREVLQLSAEGYSYAEIADHLIISPRTVETHRNNVMRKLSLTSLPDLVRYAIRHGLISVDD